MRKESRKMQLILYVVFVFITLNSCDFTYTYWSDGIYFVTDSSSQDNSYVLRIKVSRSGSLPRVGYVNEIGRNNKYIIAKSIFKNKIDYWILDKNTDNIYINPDEAVMGPYSRVEFNNLKKELGIEFLTFQKSFE